MAGSRAFAPVHAFEPTTMEPRSGGWNHSRGWRRANLRCFPMREHEHRAAPFHKQYPAPEPPVPRAKNHAPRERCGNFLVMSGFKLPEWRARLSMLRTWRRHCSPPESPPTLRGAPAFVALRGFRRALCFTKWRRILRGLSRPLACTAASAPPPPARIPTAAPRLLCPGFDWIGASGRGIRLSWAG